MSTEAIADHAAKLTRALRLEDVLINAGAVPLPVDLAPSVIPQGTSQSSEALPKDSDPGSSPGDNAQAQAQNLPHTLTEHGAVDTEPAQDAILKGLQAARDAIHDSLRQDGSVNPDRVTQSSDSHIADWDGQSRSSSAAHDSTTLGGIGDAGASDSAHPSPIANSDPANAASTPLRDQTTTSDTSPLGHVVGPSFGDVLDHTDVVENIVSNVVHDAQPIVNGLSDAAGSVATSILNSGANTSQADLAAPVAHVAMIVNDVAMPVGNVLGSGVGTDATTTLASIVGVLAPAPSSTQTIAPTPAAQNVLDAVTVPSLQGAGFDALAGLLHPSSAGPDALHADASPVHVGLEDMSTFAPIGLDDITHSDSGVTHTIHPSLPPVGSGLI